MEREFIHKIFGSPDEDFEQNALAVFRFQYRNNPVYRSFADLTGVAEEAVDRIEKIPFLPIRFFKSHAVQSTGFTPELIFESSGTTQTVNSRHLVKDAGIYRESFVKAFEHFYGNPGRYCILGLLPSYLERKNSSLVMMVDELINMSGHNDSGFYLYDHDKLYKLLMLLEKQKQQTILLGVTFGLLDFAEKYPMNLEHTIIMETGGMKGRREEMTRQEVHARLMQQTGTRSVHSEYGMTELLSQAYSAGNGLFRCPGWMKVFVREEDDPFMVRGAASLLHDPSVSGVLNVIDLANVYSCSFIATDDAARLYPDGSFEVLGRMDNSDIRGCSLMVL
jgi:hypothetical protein